jgi:hypothetical protein
MKDIGGEKEERKEYEVYGKKELGMGTGNNNRRDKETSKLGVQESSPFRKRQSLRPNRPSLPT